MRKHVFVLVVMSLFVVLMITSCGYDFEEKFAEMQTQREDQSIEYESFMKTYRKFSLKLDEEIEKTDSKYKKTGKTELQTRLEFLQEYYYYIHNDFIDAMIIKAKKLSGQEAVTAAKEIYDSTEWSGPVCKLVSNSDTIYSAHYDPSFTTLDIFPLTNALDNYLSNYDLNLVEMTDKSNNTKVPYSGASVSSPWSMTIEAKCAVTVGLKGSLSAFTTNNTDEYSVTIGDSFLFPKPTVEVYDDKYYFVDWYDGYDSYAPGESVRFTKNSNVDFKSRYLAIDVDDYYFYDSNNNDGEFSVGESGWIDLSLYNHGNIYASSVSARIESETEGVTISGGTKSFGDIYSDDSAELSRHSYSIDYSKLYGISISNTVESGTTVILKVTIIDSNGYTWTDEISFKVEKLDFDISLVGYKFQDKNGNGDNTLNIGETGYIDAIFLNNGDSTTKGITAKLECETPDVTISKATSDIYDYKSKQYRSIGGNYSSRESYINYFYRTNNCFEITLPKTIKEGTKVKFNIVLSDKIGNEKKYPFEVEAKKIDYNLSMTDYLFYDDSNRNGELELGEVAYLDVCFFNSGTENAKIVSSELICETPDVMITKNTGSSRNDNFFPNQYTTIGGDYSTSYDDIDYVYYENNCFVVRLPSDIKEGTAIKFKVKLTDTLGFVSEFPIEFVAKKQELGVSFGFGYADKENYELVYPGEDLELWTKVKNNSTTAIAHTTVTISTDSKHVTPSSRTYDYSSIINSGNYKSTDWTKEDNLSFSISSAAPIGTDIDFKIVISDMTGRSKEYNKTLTVGPRSFNPVIYESVYSSYDVNGGAKLTAGSYVYQDVVIANIGPSGYEYINGDSVYAGIGSNVSIKVISNSPELTVLKDECVIGQVYPGLYYVASRGQDQCDEYYRQINNYSIEDILKNFTNTNNGFEMKISDSAVSGEEYSFTIQVLEDEKVCKEYVDFFKLD